MESISSFFKVENDIWYQKGYLEGFKEGFREGFREGFKEVISKFMEKLELSDEQAISIVESTFGGCSKKSEKT